MSATPTDVVKEFLQNTAPNKVEAAARRLGFSFRWLCE
jgi:hypothetical protein